MYDVKILNDKNPSVTLLEGELFTKTTCIELTVKQKYLPTSASTSQDEIPCVAYHRPPGSSTGARTVTANGTPNLPALSQTDLPEHGGYQPFHLSTKYQGDKEDWYHSLIAASRLQDEEACEKDSRLFRQEDMEGFIDQLDSTPELSSARVLNGLLGTLFFRNYRKHFLSSYLSL